MDSMYDVLLQLPIFQGVSRNKISELIEKMKFHFLKYPDGDLPHQFVEHTLSQIAKGTRKFYGSFVQRPQRTTGILGVESHATKIGRHTHHLQTKRFIRFLRCATVGIPVYPR